MMELKDGKITADLEWLSRHLSWGTDKIIVDTYEYDTYREIRDIRYNKGHTKITHWLVSGECAMGSCSKGKPKWMTLEEILEIAESLAMNVEIYINKKEK